MDELDPSAFDVVLPPVGRGRPAVPTTLEFVRELLPEDVPALSAPLAPELLQQAPPELKALRTTHHVLAQHLATGVDDVTAAMLTGYDVGTVRLLKRSPAFAELLGYYGAEREIRFADTLERMRVLGLTTLEEIQRRLEEEGSKFSNRELMELAEMLLLKPAKIAAEAGGRKGGEKVEFNISFVTPEETRAAGVTIDGEVLK